MEIGEGGRHRSELYSLIGNAFYHVDVTPVKEAEMQVMRENLANDFELCFQVAQPVTKCAIFRYLEIGVMDLIAQKTSDAELISSSDSFSTSMRSWTHW